MHLWRVVGDTKGLLGDYNGYANTPFAPPRRPRPMIAQDILAYNPQALHTLADQLHAYVRDAAAQGTPAHEAERTILQHVLDMGRAALGLFFRLQGTGDLGQTLPLPGGPTADRLD